MRTFALAALAASAVASYGSDSTSRQINYGTTGHYGNQYGHGGNDDHDHQDHIYGYDSIASTKALRSTAGNTRNTLLATNIKTAIDLAQTARLNYLADVRARKENRLTEIRDITKIEIDAPWNYQLELLRKEEDDITVALTEAFLDANAAFDDMILRMERLLGDKLAGLDDEIEEIKQAIDRSEFDQKDVCKVLFAMRLDILKNVNCDSTVNPGTSAYLTDDPLEFREYEGLFDDFHYDIGHGKGTGEGDRDNGPVVDGYGGAPPASGPVGDYEVDVGARTRTWEGNLYAQPKGGYGY